MKKKVLLFSFLFFLLDQMSKVLLDNMLSLNKSITISKRFIYISKIYNDGVSFGLFSGHVWLIVLISIIITFLLYLYMKRFKNTKLNIITFSLIFGGLFGNLLDRILYGYVIDFIDVYIFNYNFPVFNLADSFIFIGVCLLFYLIYKGEDNEDSSK